ncbi:hypothetical protein [Sphingobium sp. B2]|uniref:hypothetical protein n=1 Tax=Sphingobium sp. B2 TaxID=2583228 RepID=UPI00119CC5E3|nr:hypothetical protein [Sphingobium sp. B2]
MQTVGYTAKLGRMIGKWFKRYKRHLPSQPRISWPGLPQNGFIAGRSARVGDVDRGKAVFSQRTHDSSAKAYPIVIPQYAFWKDEGGSAVPVIVVQAECHIAEADGKPIIGLRTLDGESIVASLDEVEFLGTDLPI